MLEFFRELFDIFFNFWVIISTKTITELPIVHLLVITVIMIFLFKLLKYMFIVSKQGINKTVQIARRKIKIKKDEKASTFCLGCGRTLEKCICPSKKRMSLNKKYKLYKVELKKRKSKK